MRVAALDVHRDFCEVGDRPRRTDCARRADPRPHRAVLAVRRRASTRANLVASEVTPTCVGYRGRSSQLACGARRDRRLTDPTSGTPSRARVVLCRLDLRHRLGHIHCDRAPDPRWGVHAGSSASARSPIGSRAELSWTAARVARRTRSCAASMRCFAKGRRRRRRAPVPASRSRASPAPRSSRSCAHRASTTRISDRAPVERSSTAQIAHVAKLDRRARALSRPEIHQISR